MKPFLAGFAFALFPLCCSAEIPSWVREFATKEHPAYPAATKAVVLFNEEKVTVDDAGKHTTQVRKAIKILTNEGRSEAFGAIVFDNKGSRIRDARGYVLYAGGKTKEFTRKDFIEKSNVDFELYSSQKALMLSAKDSVDPGSVFAYEFTFEEQKVFSQFPFWFQDDLPAVLSRFQLTVPSGWTADAKAYSGADPKPQATGDTFIWEARNLKPFEPEPSAPAIYSQLPRLSVGMRPAGGTPASTAVSLASFASWKEVSVWKSKLSDPQAEVSAAVEAKVRELTAGKAAGSLESIRALAEFAQGIRYVAISTNIARGGGYVPHTADAVLKASYGDCKDKANLLRAMLKAAGVESYMVSIYSGNPRYAQEDFPSPFQFNHAILAIRAPESAPALPAMFTPPGLGRFLLFDPTDSHVPFGYLPGHEQNSFALLVAGEKGSLFKTPSTKPADNHVDRKWKVALTDEGGLTGTLEEITTGQEAFDNRRELESLSKDGFRKRLEARISRGVPGAELTSFEPVYDVATNSFRTRMTFKASNYARIMAGRLWAVRTAPMPFNGTPNVNKPTREQPVLLRAASFAETIDWEIPAALKLDELPDPGKLSSPFGSFQSTWKQDGSRVHVERGLTLENTILPVEDYKQIREFFLRFHGAESAPIVLTAAK